MAPGGRQTDYNRQMEAQLAAYAASGVRPRVLLHVCCAPCASAVLERLEHRAELTLFFYNPNLASEREFFRREKEVERLLRDSGRDYAVLCPPYDPEPFCALARGLESCPEGGARCARCYRLRLAKTAETAARSAFDAFATTLSVSPHKNAVWLNEIGEELGAETGVPFLHGDFKKKDGYRRSVELSRRYGLYRQDFCGCAFSRRDAEARRSERGGIT